MVGAKDYFFTLTVEGQEPNSTTTTTTQAPSTTSGTPEPKVTKFPKLRNQLKF